MKIGGSWETKSGDEIVLHEDGNLYSVDKRNGELYLLATLTYEGFIGNVQGGWAEVVKFKDKAGNWRTRKTWGSGKAGW